MKISVAQIQSIKGDIANNIKAHIRWIEMAVLEKAEVIIFPELSLTGYEPSLAKELASTSQDDRLAIFQSISDSKNITIGVGLPIQTDSGVCIGMVLFAPNLERQTYLKKYLHVDEDPFFVSGQNTEVTINAHPKIALAICYEISIPEHPQLAKEKGATIYIASVAKTEKGVIQACQTLAQTAKLHQMTVLMSNSIGPNDDFISAGQSAIWNSKGELLGNLDSSEEGILVLDTSTMMVASQRLTEK